MGAGFVQFVACPGVWIGRAMHLRRDSCLGKVGYSKARPDNLRSGFALGILSEAAQIPGPRDASMQDLVSDWLGATAALLFALAFNSGGEIRRRSKIAAAFAGTVVLIFALSSIIVVSVAYAERSHQYPVLVSFSARFGHYFRRTQHASLVVRRDEKYGQLSGQITLNEGAWPGIIFHDIWPDWRDYSALLVEF